ncbi:MAG: polysaccharide biosynthesis tyrosine autokinase [Phormidesmis sp.]
MEPSQMPPSSPDLNGNGAHNGNGSSPANGNGSTAVASKPVPTIFMSPERSPSMLEEWQLRALQEEDNDLRNLLMVVRRRAWVIVGVAALVMAFTATRTLEQEKIYQGQFRLLVEPVNAEDDFSDLAAVLGEQRLGKAGLDYATQVQVLRSPELVEPVAEQLQRNYPDLSYLTLLKNLNIVRLGETKILEVSYTSADPVQALQVLDQLSEAYLRYSLEERQTNLRQGISFVEEQLPNLQSQVNRIQDRLEDFRRQYNFITPEIQSAQLSAQTTGLSEQRLALNRQFSEAEQVFSNLQAPSGALAALNEAPVYQQLLSELRSVETKIAAELTRFSPNSLAIRVLEEQRANMLPLLQQEAQRVVGTQQAIATNDLQVIEGQSETLAQAEQQMTQGLSQLPTLIRQYTDLQRELEIATEALTRFRVTRENLAIEAAQTEIPWQLIEAPAQPATPISPDLKRSLLVGLVASVLLGLVAALLLEKLDNVYHAVDELKAGTKLPLLGTLPFNRELNDSSRRQGVIAALSDRLSTVRQGGRSQTYGYSYGGSEASFLEALRVLHTNIRMLSSDRPIRSILISSALPGDGKSTVAANLAQVATAMGQRVLVVDVDLRKPQVHERLEITNGLGLSNLIADNLSPDDVIRPVTPTGNLFALTAGKIPPDPTKLLASQKMQQLMRSFERSFDLVIYDAPPAAGLADVSLIGQHTDGLVLVTRMGKTDRTVLSQTIETFKMAQIAILGIVANGIRSHGYGGYRYYAYGAQVQTTDVGDEAASGVIGSAPSQVKADDRF